MPYQAVYHMHCLCALEYAPRFPTSERDEPLLDLWFWPLTPPVSRSELNHFVGKWDGEKHDDSWNGRRLERYGARLGYYLGDRFLETIETHGKHYALSVGTIPYLRPKVRASVELRWHARAVEPQGYWETYSRSKGWQHFDTRVAIMPRNFLYAVQFQYVQKGEWQDYGEPLVLSEAHIKPVVIGEDA